MYKSFLNTITLAEAYRDYVSTFQPAARTERLATGDSLGRVLAADVLSCRNLPGFERSSVDGYAVVASSTFGASGSNPIFMPVTGSIEMGLPPKVDCERGRAVEIPTGGALPPGADAVVMLEYTSRFGNEVEIRRPVAPGENVIGESDDVAAGERLFTAGNILTPAAIGMLAALGIEHIEVFRPLDVAVLATGDELVPWDDDEPDPFRIRNINSPVAAAFLRTAGHHCRDFGIVPDEGKALVERLEQAVEECDLVLLSGGSSAGARDYACEAIESLPGGKVLFHGLRIAPGKPTVLGGSYDKPVVGLPGHPVSCAVVLDRLVLPLVRRLAGERKWLRGPVASVRLTENVSSRPGREEFLRVRLADAPMASGARSNRAGGYWWAVPLRGPSGAISTLARADGLVRIPPDTEGLRAGEAAWFFQPGGGVPFEPNGECFPWDDECI